MIKALAEVYTLFVLSNLRFTSAYVVITTVYLFVDDLQPRLCRRPEWRGPPAEYWPSWVYVDAFGTFNTHLH